ncbi:hypothetical protein B0H66DRAFT_520634 [Apodospora peruviana]|uniref:Uncharacterized protein n=1 Tax=Apodospora peruviana TaxID=516989 RepID=A0AAE0HXB0_9PEZI|nr:hypothetical protein B0H66DRAFT_520634 [Apodospora peruviana]
MKLVHLLSAASVAEAFSSRGLLKRSFYDVCENDCSLAGIPMPDHNNFGLPLEGGRSEQCPPIIIGDYNVPTASSRVCLDFVGPYLVFNVEAFSGYTTKSATVTWKLLGNMLTGPVSSAPPPFTASITCSPAASGTSFVCKLPFTDILNKPSSTSITDLLSGMCPNGDREGLGFYLAFSGEVDSSTGVVETFQQQHPCTSSRTNNICTSWSDLAEYIEVAYRCTNCRVTPAPPTLKTCSFGTAFGYQNPVGGTAKSFTLNTQSGQGCNRWGWYETPTLAELQGGISGPLYVGAGGNDITKAVDVGIWVATANALGRVTVTYLLNPPYALAEVHVKLACLPIDKCAPGQYTYNAGTIPNLPTWSNPTPLVYPTCSGGAKAALIVHAAVNILSVTSACGTPVL